MDGGNRNRHAQGSARGRGARPARRPARRFRGPGDELALYQWAHELGEPAFALEGAGSYGAGLARFLQAAGCPVYECERPKRAERRHGKSDLIDALLAARRLLGGERLGAPRGLSGPREDLRLLLLERRSAIRARTATLNQLQAVLVTAPERLRSRLPAVTASSSRARSCVCGRVRLSSRSCLASCAASAGAYSASTPSWRSSSASWRRSCRRHRLNRGGDRQLNRALHVISLSRVRYHAETAAYHQRLLASGKTTREWSAGGGATRPRPREFACG